VIAASVPPNSIVVAPFDDQSWIVAAEYAYQSTEVCPGLKIVVPAGFVTDGASVPRILWNVLPPFGLHFTASVVHDYLYRALAHLISRKVADKIFLEILKRDGVPAFRRKTMYQAVRKCGYAAYYHGQKAAELAGGNHG
jgi:hypothetical protein